MHNRISSTGDKLQTVLIAQNLLDESSARRARAAANAEGTTFDRALLALGLIEEPDLLKVLAEVVSFPYVTKSGDVTVDEVTLNVLSKNWCRSNKLVPLIAEDETTCLVLTSNPLNSTLAAEVEFLLEKSVSLCVAPQSTIRELLSQSEVGGEKTMHMASKDSLVADGIKIKEESLDGPVIRFVTETLETAVTKGASDIHFESQDTGLRIRFRIDGSLQSAAVDNELSSIEILARIKVLSSMNVSERRLPQDGRISQTIGGRNVDFRVSSVPTSFGESIVCRILDPTTIRKGWHQLGFDDQTVEELENIVERPSGLFLVTGPTGSGKTTTLYAALQHLNRIERKIITVEDPIEYNLAGIEQVQVHEEIGMTFATALRAFLRQDPNVIMVGEIRDQETAEIACRAALVGRMVLSTLHTNSAEGAVARLLDLGVDRYIVSDVLQAVMAQKLEPNPSGGRGLKFELLDFSNHRLT